VGHIGWFESELEAAVAHALAALYFNDPAKTNGVAAERLDLVARLLPYVVERLLALEERLVRRSPRRPKAGPDLIVEDHGSVFILRGQTDAGYVWVEEHVSSAGYQPFGLGVRLVEHRYIANIVNGAASAWLVVQGG
jgi:hypothetical protein